MNQILKPIQFNIILGLVSMTGLFLSHSNLFFSVPLYVYGIASIFLYVGEYWAFIYKIKFARLRFLYQLSNGNPKTKIGEGSDPGCMIFYAFLMRFVFRIALGMVAILGFGGDINKDMNTFQIIMMISITLFEVFNMMYSMFETHVFKLNGEYADTEKEVQQYWEKEANWRSKNFPLLENKETVKKEFWAGIILLVMAFVTTHLFWDAMNQEFIDFIVRTKKDKESVGFAVSMVLISCFVLCLFFLMPVRLAFWLEQKMNADEKPEILRYRLSLVFAGISICSPCLLQLIKSFVFA